MANNTQTYGIVLPIAHGPQGFFNQSYNVVEQVKSNLNMLLRTRKGERRMNPDFGSGLWSVLFENYNEDITPLIENTIRQDINRWMNYVSVKDVQIDTTSEQVNNKIGVKVLFTVPNAGVTQIQTLEVVMNTGKI
jgi:phage baseplate assembly protein W